MKIRFEKTLNDDAKYPILKGQVIRKYWSADRDLLLVESGRKFKTSIRPVLCCSPILPAIYIDRKEAACVLRHWRKG